MNALLFSLPGTPVIYYGDEIGMGDNIYLGDRDGVRTPMQWAPDRNAGFSQGNPQSLFLPVIIDPEYHYESVNVESQQKNPASLLSWMKRLIAQRKRFKAFGRGTLQFLRPENPRILAFVRQYQDETILIVANLSRFTQYARLDLSAFRGLVPVELFGRISFPTITDESYFVTIGPHHFYWFSLEPQPARRRARALAEASDELPLLEVSDGWESLLTGQVRSNLEGALQDYLSRRRFSGHRRAIRYAEIEEAVPVDPCRDDSIPCLRPRGAL